MGNDLTMKQAMAGIVRAIVNLPVTVACTGFPLAGNR